MHLERNIRYTLYGNTYTVGINYISPTVYVYTLSVKRR